MMKQAHERNQECLPPKKRELPVNNNNSNITAGGGTGGNGGGAEESVSTSSSGSTGSDVQGHSTSGEWIRAQPAPHYSSESSDGMGVPVDQFSMLYKVALPSGTYSPSSLHPVLNMSHLSPAYSVPPALLQHPGIPYSPLGYAQIPHSSLQFVGSHYAVPYAVPPGFVPTPLISPQAAISQQHVSHLVPYPPVIHEGVITPPPQTQPSGHGFAKVATAGGLSVVITSEQAMQPQPQHLGMIGGLTATEVSPRGVPIFYQHPSARASTTAVATSGAVFREALSHHDDSIVVTPQQDKRKEENGEGDSPRNREMPMDTIYSHKNVQVLHMVTNTSRSDSYVDGQNVSLRQAAVEERTSPSHRSTPDTDLEVQQVVGRLVSPSAVGSRKKVSVVPLNLSQGSHQSREAMPAAQERESARAEQTVMHSTMQSGHHIVPLEQRIQQHGHPPHQAVVLANGQPLLVPLDHVPQMHSSGIQQSNVLNTVAEPIFSKETQPPPTPSVSEKSSGTDTTDNRGPTGSAPAPPHPSHFMKGAIIQLATGELKRVEDLQTQDFVRSAEVSNGLKIDSSIVMDIRKSQQKPGLVALQFTVGEQQNKVTIDVPPEHPFFVFGQGWSSCSPDRTVQLYGLSCHQLQLGDVCVSLTLQQQSQARTIAVNSVGDAVTGSSQTSGPPESQQVRTVDQYHTERTCIERQGEAEAMQVERGVEESLQSKRTLSDQAKGQTNYYLHTENLPGTRVGTAVSTSVSRQHWPAPNFQRYGIKNEERVSPSSGPSRPSFIPQEVKLSIEGRSNAGK
ncbi:ataxin-1-like [Erpetoichthys calabaricus]|uniref:Ataxin 1 like n=1 Tax=Erpetoichthys calabaricus TaxID=27687 RepID=A0A8C4SMM4_ERPCA|nr:ataxin-1-like [Erpetoichthys calabaricus]